MNYNSLMNKPTINYRELIGDNAITEVGGITEEQFNTLLNTDLASYYTKAQIDDLFSRSYVLREKTGSVVNFNCPVSTPAFAQIVSYIVAVQSGSGDPSSSNIRPFTGWSAVERRRTGVNIWGGEALKDDFVRSTSNVTVDTTNKYLSFPYTATTTGLTYGHVKFKEHTQYTIILTGYNTSTSSKLANLRVYYSNGTFDNLSFNTTEATKQTSVFVTAEGKTVRYINKYSSGGNTVLYYDECGVFEGNITEQEFVPYSGETYITTLKDSNSDPLTCYGGGLMNAGGSQALLVTKGHIASYNGEALPSTWESDRDVYAAGTTPSIGAEVVYELETPLQIPQDSLSIVSTGGINNIWCNSGDIIVRALDKIIQG